MRKKFFSLEGKWPLPFILPDAIETEKTRFSLGGVEVPVDGRIACIMGGRRAASRERCVQAVSSRLRSWWLGVRWLEAAF